MNRLLEQLSLIRFNHEEETIRELEYDGKDNLYITPSGKKKVWYKLDYTPKSEEDNKHLNRLIRVLFEKEFPINIPLGSSIVIHKWYKKIFCHVKYSDGSNFIFDNTCIYGDLRSYK